VNTLYLVDTSAWARVRNPAVADQLEPLLTAGRIATCAMLDLEALRQARDATSVEQVMVGRDGLRWLPTPDDVWDRVLEVQAELSSSGRRTSVAVPDLIIAAVAARHQAVVLHYDRDYDVIAEITGQPVEWVVPACSVN